MNKCDPQSAAWTTITLVLVAVFLAGRANAWTAASQDLPTSNRISREENGTNLANPIQFHWPISRDSIVSVDRALFASTFCSYVDGERLYVGAGTAVVIYDITQPDAPSRMGSLYTDGTVWNMCARNDTLYVADGLAGMRIYDCTTQSECRKAGSYNNPPETWAYGISLDGDNIYLADGTAGVVIIRLHGSGGTEPVGFVEHWPDGYLATDVRANGGLVFATATKLDDGMLLIIDASDPSSADTIRTVVTHGLTQALHVEPDTTVYVANGFSAGSDTTMLIYDCSNPQSPVEIGSYVDPRGHIGLDVAVEADKIYLADGYLGDPDPEVSNFLIFDRAETAPGMSPAGSFNTRDYAWGVSAKYGIAYVSDEWGGLVVVDCRTISDPRELITFDLGGYPHDLVKKGDKFYVAEDGSRIRIVDSRIPGGLAEVGVIPIQSHPNAMVARGDTLLVAEGWDWVQGHSAIEAIAVNVDDPSDFTYLDSLDFDWTPHCFDVFLDGEVAYVAKGYDGLVIVDASNMEDLGVIETFDTNGRTFGVFAQDTVAYLADGAKGLRLINVADPASPHELGHLDWLLGTSYSVFVKDTLAYLADGAQGLRVINCADPTNPQQLDRIDTDINAIKVTVSGSLAYVSDDYGGLLVFDVSDPTNLALYSAYDTTGSPQGMLVQGRDIYVADALAGLLHLHMGPFYQHM